MALAQGKAETGRRRLHPAEPVLDAEDEASSSRLMLIQNWHEEFGDQE